MIKLLVQIENVDGVGQAETRILLDQGWNQISLTELEVLCDVLAYITISANHSFTGERPSGYEDALEDAQQAIKETLEEMSSGHIFGDLLEGFDEED